MTYDEELERLKIFNTRFPEINPVIKELLKKQKKNEIIEEIKNKELFKCNRCLQYFEKDKTIMYKYPNNSKRAYRLCLNCKIRINK